MFTGIVQETAIILSIIERTHFRTHIMQFTPKLLVKLQKGASVAHNGCCLTVTKIDNEKVSFDLIKETLKLTNLGMLQVGDSVNIERPAKYGDEIGGHIVSGHVMTTAKISKIFTSENNYQLWLSIYDKSQMKYIFHKGFITIDGISVTIGNVINNDFCVNLIPETLASTTLGKKRLNDQINIEIDLQTQIIVNTVERIILQKEQKLVIL
ncbi:Riboflavin synthase [Candidatus Hartigia pinicola]|nr:Riboflavin synthase [Candidatus Hartigia pinicola]